MKEIEIHDPAMVRSMAYDMGLEDPEKFLAELGYPAVSEEGTTMERQASMERMSRVMAALPLFMRQSSIAAEVMLYTHLHYGGSEPPEEFDESMRDKVRIAYYGVALASIMSSLAFLLELNVLTFNKEQFGDSENDH